MMNAFDEDRVCVAWNRECERVTGYSAEEMVGKQALDIVVPDSTYRETMMAEWDNDRDVRDGVWRFTRKNGDDRDISWSSIAQDFPVLNWATWGIGVDVTERNAAQNEVRTQGDRMRAVFDTLHEGLVLADDSGDIVDINPVVMDMFGYDRQELIGENLSILMTEENSREHDGYLDAFSKTGKKNIIGKGRKLAGRNKSGEAFPIHLHVAEFEREGRKYFVGSTQDLTENETLEAFRRQSEKLAAVGRLASGIAHDFNNLLLPIITLTELMLTEQGSAEKRVDRHEVVLAAAERGREIVEKFLAFSRENSLATKAVDLPALIEEVVSLLRESALGTLSFQSPAQPVPPVTANSGELHEVIVNLVVNALDAVDGTNGEVNIEIEHVSSSHIHAPPLPGAHSYVRLSVTDNGVGMDQTVMDRMFDPFFTTKEVGVGSGLGLSVVHGIVERMHGAIDVSSKPGEGATVTIYLPAMTIQ